MEEIQVQIWRVTVTQERSPLCLIKGMSYRNSVQTHTQSFTAEPWHLQLSLRSYWYVSCINSPASRARGAASLPPSPVLFVACAQEVFERKQRSLGPEQLLSALTKNQNR